MQTADLTALLSTVLAKHRMPPVGQRPYDLTLGALRQPPTDRFLDVGFVLWREVQGGPIQAYVYRCVTSPGLSAILKPTNPRGVFSMLDDNRTPRLWRLGYHKYSTAGTTRPGLVQDANAVVRGYRDNDRDNVFERLIPSNGDAKGINHHDGMDDRRMLVQAVGRNSEGCRVTSKSHIARVRDLLTLQAQHGLGELVSDHLFSTVTNPEVRPIFDHLGIPFAGATP